VDENLLWQLSPIWPRLLVIGNQPAAEAALIRALSGGGEEVEQRAVWRLLGVVIKMFTNRTSVSSYVADPWSFWGKPMGSGVRAATLYLLSTAETRTRDQMDERL